MKTRKLSERGLFITLWIFLLIGVGLWRYSDRQRIPQSVVLPKILMAKGLLSLFEGAQIEEIKPSYYFLMLQVKDTYLTKLQGTEKKLHVGFELRGPQTTLARGVTLCLIQPHTHLTRIRIENSKRVSPKQIHLYLPH